MFAVVGVTKGARIHRVHKIDREGVHLNCWPNPYESSKVSVLDRLHGSALGGTMCKDCGV